MHFKWKIRMLPVLLLMVFVLSSCSVLRGRKCNCPQWSMDDDFDSEIVWFDEPAA